VTRSPTWTAAGLLAVVVALATGCGGGDDNASAPRHTTTTEAASTSTTLSAEDQVLAVYARGQEALTTAYDPPDPNNAELLATVSGPLLARHQAVLTEYQTEGVSEVTVSKQSDPHVVEVGATTATIENCLTEVLQLMDSASRAPRGDPRTLTGLSRIQLQVVDGAWKLVDGQVVAETC